MSSGVVNGELQSAQIEPLHLCRIEGAATLRKERADAEVRHDEEHAAFANVGWLDVSSVHKRTCDVPLLPVARSRIPSSAPRVVEVDKVSFFLDLTQGATEDHTVLLRFAVASDEIVPGNDVVPCQLSHVLTFQCAIILVA